jgi:hypothetical protein
VADAWGGSWGSAWGVSWGAGVEDDTVLSGTGGAGTIKKRRRLDDLYSPHRFDVVARKLQEQKEAEAKRPAEPDAIPVEAPKGPKLSGSEYLASLGITPSLAPTMGEKIDTEIDKLRADALRQQEDEDDAAILLLLSQY